MMTSLDLLDEIQALEEALHRKEVRSSRVAVEKLLADDFVEFGSSGRKYRREEMIALLEQENGSGPEEELFAYDYALNQISPNAVLLTYETRRGLPGRYVLRSSIWKQTEGGWKMLFHQGTKVNSVSVQDHLESLKPDTRPPIA